MLRHSAIPLDVAMPFEPRLRQPVGLDELREVLNEINEYKPSSPHLASTGPSLALSNQDTAIAKAKKFRELVANGTGNPSVAFEDFGETFLLAFEDLRLTYSQDLESSWWELLHENIRGARPLRDALIDVAKTGIAHVREDWFSDDLLRFLELVLGFQNRPRLTGKFFEISEDNYRFLLYEIFLYVFATCVRSRRHGLARALIEHQYVSIEDSMESSRRVAHDYTSFNSRADSLENQQGATGNRRRISVSGDLVIEGASRRDISFSDLLQADILCCLAGWWYPRCLVYGSEVGTLELFARATTEQGRQSLQEILKVDTAVQLVKKLVDKTKDIEKERDFFYCRVSLPQLLNLDELYRAWIDNV